MFHFLPSQSFHQPFFKQEVNGNSANASKMTKTTQANVQCILKPIKPAGASPLRRVTMNAWLGWSETVRGRNGTVSETVNIA